MNIRDDARLKRYSLKLKEENIKNTRYLELILLSIKKRIKTTSFSLPT